MSSKDISIQPVHLPFMRLVTVLCLVRFLVQLRLTGKPITFGLPDFIVLGDANYLGHLICRLLKVRGKTVIPLFTSNSSLSPPYITRATPEELERVGDRQVLTSIQDALFKASTQVHSPSMDLGTPIDVYKVPSRDLYTKDPEIHQVHSIRIRDGTVECSTQKGVYKAHQLIITDILLEKIQSTSRTANYIDLGCKYLGRPKGDVYTNQGYLVQDTFTASKPYAQVIRLSPTERISCSHDTREMTMSLSTLSRAIDPGSAKAILAPILTSLDLTDCLKLPLDEFDHSSGWEKIKLHPRMHVINPWTLAPSLDPIRDTILKALYLGSFI